MFWETYCTKKKYFITDSCSCHILYRRGDYVMSKLKKIVKRYLFFLFLLLLNVLLLIVQPKLGREVISLSLDNLLEMLSIIPPIFLLLGLMDVWVPKETIMKFMGKDAGIKGGIFAFVLGSFSSGPLYASFPVAMVFLKKGVSLINIFIFLGAWSTTKIPMMLFEITQLGSKFALIRFCLNLIAIIVLAIIMEKTTTKKDIDAMYKLASQQVDES